MFNDLIVETVNESCICHRCGRDIVMYDELYQKLEEEGWEILCGEQGCDDIDYYAVYSKGGPGVKFTDKIIQGMDKKEVKKVWDNKIVGENRYQDLIEKQEKWLKEKK